MNMVHAHHSNYQRHANIFFKMSLLIIAVSLFSGTAAAHCLTNKYYAGAGLTFNSLDNYDDANGLQVFGGYCLGFIKQNAPVRSALELGFMDSGDFKRDTPPRSVSAEGLWFNLVGEYLVDRRVHLLGRLGFDTGDDDGIMAGFGLGFNLSKRAQLRAEYVVLDNINATKINLLTGF